MSKTLAEFADEVDELNKLAASRAKSRGREVGREVVEYCEARRAKHTQKPMGLYKIQDDSVGLATVASPSVDQSLMAASAVINTTAIDREGEVILPQGVRFDDYRRNPLVLWNHGMSAIETPIAKCEHPDGSLAIEVSEDTMEGTSYFTNTLRESEQIFDLITQGIVRATSIHVAPTAKSFYQVDGQQVAVIEESAMIEWSWGCIGVNPEALAKVFSVGRLAGSQISESIRKSLSPFAAVAKGTGIGAQFTEESGMAKMDTNDGLTDDATKAELEQEDDATKAEIPGEETDDAVKLDDELAEDAEKIDELTEEAAKMEDEVVDASTELAEDTTTPLGAQVVAELHNELSNLVDIAAQAAKPVENPETKELIATEVAAIEECLTRIEGAFSSIYPEEPSLASTGETTDTVNVEAVKSWLAGGQRREFALSGIGQKLAAIATAKNLRPAQRNIMSKMKTMLDKIVVDARNQTGREEAAAIERLEAGLSKLAEKIEGMTPNRS